MTTVLEFVVKPLLEVVPLLPRVGMSIGALGVVEFQTTHARCMILFVYTSGIGLYYLMHNCGAPNDALVMTFK